MLTKQQIKRLFEILNGKLRDQKVKGEIVICGGAVMCLVFQTRESTKDIDAIFAPTDTIRNAVRQISLEEGLPEDWLNDAAKAYFMSELPRVPVMALSNLNVWAPSADYMLAMKCVSARFDSQDRDDVIFLIKHLGLNKSQDVFNVIEKYYPHQSIPAKTQFFVEEILADKF